MGVPQETKCLSLSMLSLFPRKHIGITFQEYTLSSISKICQDLDPNFEVKTNRNL